MSDIGNSVSRYLQRWSQRKRAAGMRDSERVDRTAAADKGSDLDATAAPDVAAVTADLAALPPIESITGASDVRAFLAPGVPVELQRAALRHLWRVDPTIHDFIGIAENQWDFANPDTVPGFGSLQITAALQSMLDTLTGAAPEQLAVRRDENADKTVNIADHTPSSAEVKTVD
jgi:hypothetical protein